MKKRIFLRIVISCLILFSDIFLLFGDTNISFNDLLGAWNIGAVSEPEEVKDMDGNKYFGDYKTIFIERNRIKKNEIYWNNVRLNSIKGNFILAEVNMELFLDVTKKESKIFRAVIHFISNNEFWIDVQENGFSKNELKMFRSYIKDGKDIIYTRATKVNNSLK